ncbi:hypothetical protein KGF54_001050 [Candida jiufengensis]|uniref:uncharacterized protein n=1 Tax=Candida jiufengensis TaxID=497108 RepID=UPI002224D195|nr:uncharacterized protein KGF54_001050 [Candida jiufengensis]KAI5956575.1 hypothetical protein KGF54_001050 [Candida jiufengensis]
MGFFSFLFIYLLGLISPFLIILLIFNYVLKDVKDEEDHDLNTLNSDDLKAGELEEKHQSGLESFKNGWIFVTNEYIESTDEINRNTTPITDLPENKSAYSSLFKLVNKEQQQREQELLNNPTTEDDDLKDDAASIHSIQPSITQTSSTPTPQPQKQPTQQSTQAMRQSLKKHRYFAVLKHGNLFLYKDQTLKDVKHVIVLSSYFVSIWPRDLTDAQLFTKYTAIALINTKKLNTNAGNSDSNLAGSFFIYCDYVSDKEDWYFSLIRSTKSDSPNNNIAIPSNLSPNKFANTLHFSTKEMINLIQALYSSEGHLQTKWMNALIGRWFLAIKDTQFFENYIYTKLSKKLDKIKKPGFFEEFQITDIQPGSSAPFFTYPNLKEINPDGTLVVNGNVSYNGGLSVTIATKLDLSFGTKLTKEVDLVLKITLVKLEGPILIKLKPPPSNRFWYCYEVEPILNFKIEPILSTKSLNYSFITSSIEKKFKEAIKESLVLPHWDDIVFFDTKDELYRGGIWKNDDASDERNDDQQSIIETDTTSTITDQMIDSKANLTPTANQNKYAKLSKNITDLTKKMKKKSSSPSTEDFQNSTLAASQPTKDSNNTSSVMSNTFKKIGKWYFKEDRNAPPPLHDQENVQQVTEKPTLSVPTTSGPPLPKRSNSNASTSTTNSTKSKEQSNYHPPEMISKRRPPRKSSNASTSILKTNDKFNNNGIGAGGNSPILQSSSPPTTNTGLSTATTPPQSRLQSPSFSFAKFDHTIDSNIDLPPAYLENEHHFLNNNTNISTNTNTHNSNSSISSLSITASQLAASRSFNSLNKIDATSLKRKPSSTSTVQNTTTLNTNQENDEDEKSYNFDDSLPSHSQGDSSIGRSKTLRKPPPKSPILEPTTTTTISNNINLSNSNSSSSSNNPFNEFLKNEVDEKVE